MIPLVYHDIGHGLDAEHSTIWKLSWTFIKNGQAQGYSRPRLEVYSARVGTHETVFGEEVVKSWRGRYDTKSRLVSVAAPDSWTSADVPEALTKLLLKEFGTGVEIWYFPMAGLGKRVA